MNDPELRKVGIFVGAGLIGIAILNSVYQAGVSAGIGRDGRYVDHDGGLFPFPLLLIGGVVFFLYWRRRNGHGGGGGTGGGRGQVNEYSGRGFGRGPAGPPRFFEEWHRRAHENAPAGGGAAQPPVVATAPEATAAPSMGDAASAPAAPAMGDVPATDDRSGSAPTGFPGPTGPTTL